jgi:hypothetical protein
MANRKEQKKKTRKFLSRSRISASSPSITFRSSFPAFRRRVRQEQGKDAEQRGAAGGNQQRDIGGRNVAQPNICGKNPHASPEPIQPIVPITGSAEIALNVRHVEKGDAVGQRDGRHVG